MKTTESAKFKEIQSALDRALSEMWEDIISPKYKRQKQSGDHYSFGLCYVASEALMHLAKDIKDLKPCRSRVDDNTHWWLEDRRTGERIDPTAKQFRDSSLKVAFYNAGKGGGFLTKTPSKRAQKLIKRTKALL